MADILCKLKLTTENYESNLNKSRKQMQDFTQKTKNASGDFKKFESTIGTARSSFLKFAGGIGLAVTAAEGFNKLIHSSQTLSDEYDRTIEGLTGTVDNLFYSIANGDWSPFLQGLSNSIALAREAYTAMDQLGNTKISYGYFDMKNQAEMQDQIAILRDKNSTEDQKKVARAEADRILKDQKEITEQLARRSEEAMLSLVKKSTGLSDLDISQMDIDKALRLDVSAMGDYEKSKLSAMYKEFEKKSGEIKAKFTTTDVNVTGGTRGASITQNTDYKKVREELKPLLSLYQDAIIYNSTLNKETDEWLQNLTGIGETSYIANRDYSSMVKAANRASQSGNSTKEKTEKDKPIEGSIDYINAQISDLTKKLNAETDGAVRAALKMAIDKFNKEKHRLELYIEISPLESKKVVGKKASDATNDKVTPIANKKLKPAITPKDVNVTNQYNESLDRTLSMLLAIGNATNEGAAGWITYGVNSLAALNSTYQALATVIPALQVKALMAGAASAAETPIVGWITAIAAIGAMTAAFASLPKYETGGIVGANGGLIPGSSFSGDKILARMNSGELILNRAQQKNIASQLVAGGGASRIDVNVVGRVSGRDLELVMEKRNRFKSRIQ